MYGLDIEEVRTFYVEEKREREFPYPQTVGFPLNQQQFQQLYPQNQQQFQQQYPQNQQQYPQNQQKK